MSEIYLNLNKIDLYGFEHRKETGKVGAMLESIAKGDVFLPVPVYRINDKTYFLSAAVNTESGKLDGGHHRAVAHLIADKPLRCRLVDRAGSVPTIHRRNIRDITLHLDPFKV